MTDNALYIVATPIGNLSDMSPRAVDVLKAVDVIAAEDTRHSARLLQNFSISTPMVPYHDHNERGRSGALIKRLQEGESIALISDAGTPLISDPGYVLVKEVRDAGYRVVPIPGASAVIAALSASGLPSDRFVFEGFLPSKHQARINKLQSFDKEPRTIVFYESTHRITDSLNDMLTVFGPERYVVMARELTKTFETIKGDPLSDLVSWVAADNNQQKGEFVILVHGYEADVSEVNEQAEHVLDVLLAELPLKQASALAAKITGLKKNLLYQWALDKQSKL